MRRPVRLSRNVRAGGTRILASHLGVGLYPEDHLQGKKWRQGGQASPSTPNAAVPGADVMERTVSERAAAHSSAVRDGNRAEQPE